jgi:serine/threonine protein kinase
MAAANVLVPANRRVCAPVQERLSAQRSGRILPESMDPARVLARRYRLEATIGRGGMGIVHRAIDQELERAVAIKVLAENQGETALERFVVEAKRTAAVRHPCIVEVFDVGKDDGDAFMVMELLEGETLAHRLGESGAMAPGEAVAIASEICDALSAAHDAGLVHRDLKPANVFLVRTTDGALRVKLLDFGIAKRVDGETARTDPSVIVGTLEYLSPEQIRGVDLDARADLYSLGATLYRMITGELLFKGDNVAAFIHQHLAVAPMSMRERPTGGAIPAALDAVVMRLLEKDPARRPSTARDAKRELADALEGKAKLEATVPAPRPAVWAASPHGKTERVLDLDDEPGTPDQLELDHGGASPRVPPDAPRGPAIVPVDVPVPPPAPLVVAEPVTIHPWLEPLARVPEAASKRVAGYALFALLIYVVFFSGAFLPSLALALIAALGATSFWVRRRLAPPSPHR